MGYAGLVDGAEHIAVVAGLIDGISVGDVPIHLHTECLTETYCASTPCGCGRALDEAMARFATEGRGVVIYLHRSVAREPAPCSTPHISVRR